RSVQLRGIADEPFVLSNSNVVAGEIKRAIVRDVQTDNGGEPFGFATLELGHYRGEDADEDYVVRIL
ncbi:MAG: hypothetical protein ACOC9P_01465, partial [bacterium]